MTDDLRQRYAEALAATNMLDSADLDCTLELVLAIHDEEMAELRAERDVLAAELGDRTERAERAEAVVERVRSEIAAITAENDTYAVRHNPECGCEVIETTREVIDRIREALGGEHRKTWRAGTWRVGRKVGRTLYLQSGAVPSDKDMLIGVLDTVDLAARAAHAVNELAARENADG